MIRCQCNDLDVLIDESAIDPSVSAMHSELRSALRQTMSFGFRPLAKRIMRLRFAIGVEDDDALTYTLEETARITGISSHRCRAVEAMSLAKLRNRRELMEII